MGFTNPKYPFHALAKGGIGGEDFEQFILDAGFGEAAGIGLVEDYRIALAQILEITDYNAYSLNDLYKRYKEAGYPDQVQPPANLGPHIVGEVHSGGYMATAGNTNNLSIPDHEEGDLLLLAVVSAAGHTDHKLNTTGWSAQVSGISLTVNSAGFSMWYKYGNGTETTVEMEALIGGRGYAYSLLAIRDALPEADGGPFDVTPTSSHCTGEARMDQHSGPPVLSTTEGCLAITYGGEDDGDWTGLSFISVQNGAGFVGLHSQNSATDASIYTAFKFHLGLGQSAVQNGSVIGAGSTSAGLAAQVLIAPTLDYTYLDIFYDKVALLCRFDEDNGEATTIIDDSKWGHTIYITGDAAINSAMQWQGTNSLRVLGDDSIYITGADAATACDMGDGPFTVEWAFDELAHAGVDYYMRYEPSGEYHLEWYISADDLFTGFSTGGASYTTQDTTKNHGGGWRQFSAVKYYNEIYVNEHHETQPGWYTPSDPTDNTTLHPLTSAVKVRLGDHSGGANSGMNGDFGFWRITQGICRYPYPDSQHIPKAIPPVQTLAETPLRPSFVAATHDYQTHAAGVGTTLDWTLPSHSDGDVLILSRGVNKSNYTDLELITAGRTKDTDFTHQAIGTPFVEIWTKFGNGVETTVTTENNTGIGYSEGIMIEAFADVHADIFDGYKKMYSTSNSSNPEMASCGGWTRGGLSVGGLIGGPSGSWTNTPLGPPGFTTTVSAGASSVVCTMGWYRDNFEEGGVHHGELMGSDGELVDLGNAGASIDHIMWGAGLKPTGLFQV